MTDKAEAAERERFEQHIFDIAGEPVCLARWPSDAYKNEEIEYRWITWQARAALKAQPAPTEAQTECTLDGGKCGAGGYCKACHATTEAQGEAGITASGPTHEQSMAGYAVACKFGVFEGRAFTLAHEMFAAFGQPAAHVETKDQRIQRQNMQGMADCMDMVHGELIEAEIIDKRTPPMMVANAVCAHIAELHAAAAAVVARWDSPKWKDEPHTAVFIDRLRKALSAGAGSAHETSETRMDSGAPAGAGLAVQGEDSARLADGYKSSTMVSDFYGPKVTLHYETTAQADAAHDLLVEMIERASDETGGVKS